ncbi:DUF1232 domain-containing protein [Promicromonospora thailandica]|uniref:DUF1232 domain-containing protein n=1 Tax=Promicromonospora thailandica TaxID=765201 RepID=A0A9X2G141_9MICO|nr:DUF1232 domain-containing protein [Promicromonospora thailandica]MCP2263768.1 Protein of unknown function (DUF1232) [Promicromonospora thailandica]BFF17946.1 hypothetical protein GCM10025730_14670 [Promicromonospora thailandica]
MGEENKRGKDPRKFTWQEILTFIAGAGYVASPIDLLSEGVLGPLGLGDDAIAIIIAGVTLYKAVQRFRKHRDVPGASGPTTGGSPGGPTTGTSRPGPGAPGNTVPGTAEDVTDRRPRR